MTAPTRGALRVTRGAVVAVLGVLLGLCGHLAAGGGTPGAAAVLLVGVAAAGVGALLAGRSLTAPVVVTFLLGAQLLLHVVLGVGAGHAGHGGGHAGPAGPTMLLAHLVAAGVVAWLCRVADADLHAWARYLASRLGRALLGDLRPTPVRGLAPAITHAAPAPRPRGLAASPVSRRGPPVRPLVPSLAAGGATLR